MRRLNIRRWSTPLIIGTGIFVAITGLFMFLTTTDLVRFAHEIIGIGFAIAIVLHILSNWVPFKRYFANRAVIIIVLAWGVGIGLVTATVLRSTEDAEEVVVERIEQTPIHFLAPVVGVEVSVLMNQLKADGFIVQSSQMSIEQVAEQYNTATDDILLSVFR